MALSVLILDELMKLKDISLETCVKLIYAKMAIQ